MFGQRKKKENSKALTTNVVVGSPGHLSRKYENEKIKAMWVEQFRSILLANPDMERNRK